MDSERKTRPIRRLAVFAALLGMAWLCDRLSGTRDQLHDACAGSLPPVAEVRKPDAAAECSAVRLEVRSAGVIAAGRILERGFVANRGQWQAQVRYLGRCGAGTVQVQDDGLVFQTAGTSRF